MSLSQSGTATLPASQSEGDGLSDTYATSTGADSEALQPNAVFVNVYDVINFNSLFWSIGFGVHHAGIQVYGKEYQYGGCDEGSGIGVVEPLHALPHTFREQFYLGQTELSALAVQELVANLRQCDTWLGSKYHLVKHNCVHFARALCEALLPPARRVAQMRTAPPFIYKSAYTEEVEVDGQRYTVPVLIPPHVDRLGNYAAAYLPDWALVKLDSSCQPSLPDIA
ncbi:hypothetical protein JKF63_06916 [Porcisia hertigi]|uniref:PPPDE domain-containing protein n=1 Tax=Porcisia hertigi TaxID=2761500 RepID=A0A837AY95_9TRYP|nr:hypothetical protein JKF63_06916 [Porcisia hertigi]